MATAGGDTPRQTARAFQPAVPAWAPARPGARRPWHRGRQQAQALAPEGNLQGASVWIPPYGPLPTGHSLRSPLCSGPRASQPPRPGGHGHGHGLRAGGWLGTAVTVPSPAMARGTLRPAGAPAAGWPAGADRNQPNRRRRGRSWQPQRRVRADRGAAGSPSAP